MWWRYELRRQFSESVPLFEAVAINVLKEFTNNFHLFYIQLIEIFISLFLTLCPFSLFLSLSVLSLYHLLLLLSHLLISFSLSSLPTCTLIDFNLSFFILLLFSSHSRFSLSFTSHTRRAERLHRLRVVHYGTTTRSRTAVTFVAHYARSPGLRPALAQRPASLAPPRTVAASTDPGRRSADGLH